jgi:4-diphosphocytidyl-2C-methyl-D-erythritol kinase
MTGSGSVCFGVFRDKNSAKLSLRVIQKKLPNYWCVIAKSI